MKFEISIFVLIVVIYFISLLFKVRKYKIGRAGKKIIFQLNITSLFLTLILIIIWGLHKHLSNLTIELLPFWVFIITSISIYGLTEINKIEKMFYGFIYWGHLFLSVLLVIPFIGIGIMLMVYSNFIPDSVYYEDRKIIITEELRLMMSPMGSPKIYIKSEPFSTKYETDLNPIYSVDSVYLQKTDNETIEIKIINNKDNIIDSATINLNCL